MKNLNTTILLFLATIVMTLTSCEKYVSETDETAVSKEANSTLRIRTRVAETDNTEVSYPVNIYVFDSRGVCVMTASIENEGTPISMKLPEGNYDIYATAGADGSNYDLPSKEEATKESVITLMEGRRHADLMTARSTVNLVFGEENTLTITLARKVMMIEDVTINDVPGSVSAVSVTITPLYENIRLDGSYSGVNGSSTISLTRQEGTNIWKNTSTEYLLEAAGPATIKVSLTTSSTTKSYSYSCTDELRANYKIRINGTYTDRSGITLNGTIAGVAWEGTKNITFDFDESGSSTTGNGQDDVTGEAGDAPKAGSIYKGCYVLKSQVSGNSTTVTLIADGSKNALTFTRGDQKSMKEAVDNGIAELAAEGITGWRLPTLDEMTYIKENLNTINGNLTNHGLNIIADKTGGNLYSYYFLTTDGDICTYNISRGDTESNPNTGLKSLILRAFASVTFTK